LKANLGGRSSAQLPPSWCAHSELILALRMIDHDRLFKELLSTFFMEFLELFIRPFQ
jgi:hypothetical protein